MMTHGSSRAAVLLGAVAVALTIPLASHGQGSVIVRVPDPAGSHCIDATSEEITVHVRRVFIQKTHGLFSEDNRAGVLVSAKLTGRGSGPTVDVQIPSVSLVSVQEDKPGRVSLPLEYQIASYLALQQDDILTTDIALTLSLARTRGRNTFGEVLDLAGKALNKLPIPNHPYVETASKFLAFTNDAINATTKEQLDVPFAQLSLSFNKGSEPDIGKCESAGKERTGAIAVLLARGLPNSELVPMVNTSQLYCFRYSSAATYELLAAKRNGQQCPNDGNAYSSVNNDYVMMLISAQSAETGFASSTEHQQQREESRQRCRAYGLDPAACGVSN